MNAITHVSQLDSENRTTLCELIGCDAFAGQLAREYLDFRTLNGVPIERATMDLIAWLILAREACGVEGVGRA